MSEALQGQDDQEEFEPVLRTDRGPKPLWKRALLLGGAALFFALGVVFWLLPVVTGLPFYIVAFALLGAASPGAARALNRAEARLPARWRRGLRRVLAKVRPPDRPA
jgi:hypothetical protein